MRGISDGQGNKHWARLETLVRVNGSVAHAAFMNGYIAQGESDAWGRSSLGHVDAVVQLHELDGRK